MFAGLESLLTMYRNFDEGSRDVLSQLQESSVAYVPDTIKFWDSRKFRRTPYGAIAVDPTISRTEAFSHSQLAVSVRRIARWAAHSL